MRRTNHANAQSSANLGGGSGDGIDFDASVLPRDFYKIFEFLKDSSRDEYENLDGNFEGQAIRDTLQEILDIFENDIKHFDRLSSSNQDFLAQIIFDWLYIYMQASHLKYIKTKKNNFQHACQIYHGQCEEAFAAQFNDKDLFSKLMRLINGNKSWIVYFQTNSMLNVAAKISSSTAKKSESCQVACDDALLFKKLVWHRQLAYLCFLCDNQQIEVAEILLRALDNPNLHQIRGWLETYALDKPPMQQLLEQVGQLPKVNISVVQESLQKQLEKNAWTEINNFMQWFEKQASNNPASGSLQVISQLKADLAALFSNKKDAVDIALASKGLLSIKFLLAGIIAVNSQQVSKYFSINRLMGSSVTQLLSKYLPSTSHMLQAVFGLVTELSKTAFVDFKLRKYVDSLLTQFKDEIIVSFYPVKMLPKIKRQRSTCIETWLELYIRAYQLTITAPNKNNIQAASLVLARRYADAKKISYTNNGKLGEIMRVLAEHASLPILNHHLSTMGEAGKESVGVGMPIYADANNDSIECIPVAEVVETRDDPAAGKENSRVCVVQARYVTAPPARQAPVNVSSNHSIYAGGGGGGEGSAMDSLLTTEESKLTLYKKLFKNPQIGLNQKANILSILYQSKKLEQLRELLRHLSPDELSVLENYIPATYKQKEGLVKYIDNFSAQPLADSLPLVSTVDLPAEQVSLSANSTTLTASSAPQRVPIAVEDDGFLFDGADNAKP